MRWKNLLETFILGAAWGPSYMFVKIALEELSPFAIAAGRISLAAVILFIVMKIRRIKLPRFGKIWGHFFVMGFFACSLPFILFGMGELYVSSAMAGIVNGMTPIITVVLAHFLLNERLNRPRLLGISLAITGFVIILMPYLTAGGAGGKPVGIAWVCGAAVSYAIGIVYGRKFLMDLPPLVGPTCQLLISSLYMIPLAMVVRPFFLTAPLSLQGVGCIAGLGVFGTALAFFFYYRVLERAGAGYLAMATYLLPIFASLWGAVFLHEHLRWTAYLAGILILAGLIVVNGSVSLTKKAID